MCERPIYRRHFIARAGAIVGAAALASPFSSFAQPMPDLMRLLVGLPPGSLPDTMARTLAEALAGKLARNVIVEGHPGAAARLAVDVLLRTGSDGNTMMVTPSGVVTLVQYTYRNLSYRPFDDLAPVTVLSYSPFCFAIGPLVDERVRTMRDFAAWCRANPARASFATLAAGSPPHFFGEVVKQQFMFECTHVPSRTSLLPDVLGGQIAAAVFAPVTLVPVAGDKRLRILGIAGEARHPHLLDVPTFREQGVDGLDWEDWYGVYMSAKAPAPMIRRNGDILRTALSDPRLIEHWRSVVQAEPAPTSAEELDRLARADSVRWAGIVKSTGFVAE
jgi:tripartite-type tricarboxylate transporter receptor subunit TctC